MLEFADSPGCDVTLALAADGVTLDERRAQLHFRGDWAISAGQDARFFGRCTQGPLSQAASLDVEAGRGGAAALQVTLRAVDGRVVLGPLWLQQVQGRPLKA